MEDVETAAKARVGKLVYRLEVRLLGSTSTQIFVIEQAPELQELVKILLGKALVQEIFQIDCSRILLARTLDLVITSSFFA